MTFTKISRLLKKKKKIFLPTLQPVQHWQTNINSPVNRTKSTVVGEKYMYNLNFGPTKCPKGSLPLNRGYLVLIRTFMCSVFIMKLENTPIQLY